MTSIATAARPMFSFRNLNIATTVIASLLFLILLCTPNIAWWLFGIEGGESADFVARRTAMLFAGIAALCWFTRNTPAGAAQSGIAKGLALAMIGLVMLGLSEWLRGFAGIGILLAVVTELTLAVGYGRMACYPSGR